MIELNIVEASWSMDASGSWLKLKPEFPAQARMVAGELDPQKKHIVTIKEFRKKRSLDANAYQMQCSSKPGENVLDLFAGSGTTIMAAEQNGRHAYCMEFDPKYADVIIDRWEKFTGEKAVLLSDG